MLSSREEAAKWQLPRALAMNMRYFITNSSLLKSNLLFDLDHVYSIISIDLPLLCLIWFHLFSLFRGYPLELAILSKNAAFLSPSYFRRAIDFEDSPPPPTSFQN